MPIKRGIIPSSPPLPAQLSGEKPPKKILGHLHGGPLNRFKSGNYSQTLRGHSCNKSAFAGNCVSSFGSVLVTRVRSAKSPSHPPVNFVSDSGIVNEPSADLRRTALLYWAGAIRKLINAIQLKPLSKGMRWAEKTKRRLSASISM